MWWEVIARFLWVIALLLSGSTMLSLSNISTKEQDKDKKGTLGMGVICCVVLFLCALYQIVKV